MEEGKKENKKEILAKGSGKPYAAVKSCGWAWTLVTV